MPSGLKEAFKSPFHRSNPNSQFYDLSSYTRSWDSGSLRNEAYQTNFDPVYNLTGSEEGKLPRYAPNRQIPQQLQSRLDPSEIASGPSQGTAPVAPPALAPPALAPPAPRLSPPPLAPENPADEECESLINRVLANPMCLRSLKRILGSGESTIEGFGYKLPEFNRTIFIYILLGILLLALLDLFVRIGQMLAK